MKDTEQLCIAMASAIPQPFIPRRLAPHDPGHMAGVEKQRMGVDVG